MVLGWIVGGYLMAALMGVSAGARPATPRRAYFRLGAIVPYAIISGFGGAFIVDQVLGALTGHFLELALLGALLVASSATVTMDVDVQTGKAAGVPVWLVPGGALEVDAAVAAGPDRLLTGFAQLLELLPGQ